MQLTELLSTGAVFGSPLCPGSCQLWDSFVFCTGAGRNAWRNVAVSQGDKGGHNCLGAFGVVAALSSSLCTPSMMLRRCKAVSSGTMGDTKLACLEPVCVLAWWPAVSPHRPSCVTLRLAPSVSHCLLLLHKPTAAWAASSTCRCQLPELCILTNLLLPSLLWTTPKHPLATNHSTLCEKDKNPLFSKSILHQNEKLWRQNEPSNKKSQYRSLYIQKGTPQLTEGEEDAVQAPLTVDGCVFIAWPPCSTAGRCQE